MKGKSKIFSSYPSGVRLARFLRSFSQDELSARSGVDQAVISRVERGLPVSSAARRKIAVALDMSEATLFHQVN